MSTARCCACRCRCASPMAAGCKLPRLPAPLDLLAGIFAARGWTWRDKASLLRTALALAARGLSLRPQAPRWPTLCAGLTPRVMQELIEPLCVSALNTPVAQSSGEVFLRVLNDALFSEQRRRRPAAAARRPGRAASRRGDPMARRSTAPRRASAARVHTLVAPDGASGSVDGEDLRPGRAGLRARGTPHAWCARPACDADDWCDATEALRFEAIATRLRARRRAAGGTDARAAQRPRPRHRRSSRFDRGQLGGLQGLLALVVSASETPREALEEQVLAQAAAQLGADAPAHRADGGRAARHLRLHARAFAARWRQIAPGLAACGDYIDGPYPATLEGAVRSGLAAATLDRPMTTELRLPGFRLQRRDRRQRHLRRDGLGRPAAAGRRACRDRRRARLGPRHLPRPARRWTTAAPGTSTCSRCRSGAWPKR